MTSGERRWKQADSEVVLIDNMDDQHLINSIKLLQRNASKYKERLLHQGYQALTFVQGEQAEIDIERDINRIEMMNDEDFLSDTFPVYENMKILAKERGLLK